MIAKNNLVVVLVNYNGFDDTRACVESILQNEENLPYIIIVDNSVPSQTKLDELIEIYPELKIIYSSENKGFGAANNLGIEWAIENIDFNFISLLNNDTLISKNALSSSTNAFGNDSTIGIATGKIMYADRPDFVWYGGADINYRKGWPQIVDMNEHPTNEGANKSRYVSFASGCFMTFSKKSISDLKGFDPFIFMYCEDLELSIRTTKKDYKIYYNSDVVIFHKVHGSFDGNENQNSKNLQPKNPNAAFLFYNMRINQFYTMRKHFSGWNFFIFRIFFWIKFVYINLRMILHGKFSFVSTSFRTIRKIAGLKKNKLWGGYND